MGGESIVELDQLELARHLMAKAKKLGVPLLLPTDIMVEADEDVLGMHIINAKPLLIDCSQPPGIARGWKGLDVGPDSSKTFAEAISNCNTVVWNGPLGVFELEDFAAGTMSMAETLAGVASRGGTV